MKKNLLSDASIPSPHLPSRSLLARVPIRIRPAELRMPVRLLSY